MGKYEDSVKLYIKRTKKEEYDVSSTNICYEGLGFYYDIKHKIGVEKRKIMADLEVGIIYDFIYEGSNDTDLYNYVVLKRDGNIYYIAEYYNDFFYEMQERYLGDCWIKCDVKETLGIDLNEWEEKEIKCYDELPDMRKKVAEYIRELETEIDRCEKNLIERYSEPEKETVEERQNDKIENKIIESRIQTLNQVKGDLQSRLEELI